jgi:endonuclease/exonuclease/phosphatase family metal-dependent hydrolase
VISAYTPSKDEKLKDSFYQDLEEMALPPHTVVIVAGDFNAQIGMNSHESSPRFEKRMINLCEAANLRPAHSHFAYIRTCLATYPPDTKHEAKQIDHIMINTKWWKTIKNCRAFNSIDI